MPVEVPLCDECETEVASPHQVEEMSNPHNLGVQGKDGVYCSHKCRKEAEDTPEARMKETLVDDVGMQENNADTLVQLFKSSVDAMEGDAFARAKVEKSGEDGGKDRLSALLRKNGFEEAGEMIGNRESSRLFKSLYHVLETESLNHETLDSIGQEMINE